jgi:hypothetical protein
VLDFKLKTVIDMKTLRMMGELLALVTPLISIVALVLMIVATVLKSPNRSLFATLIGSLALITAIGYSTRLIFGTNQRRTIVLNFIGSIAWFTFAFLWVLTR